MKTKLTAYYSIFLGLAIIGMWIMILTTETIMEGRMEMAFHLVSEFLMALLAIVSGVLLLVKHRLAVLLNILAMGMVMYSVLNAAGYYGQRGETSFVTLFIFIFLFSGFVIFLHISSSFQQKK